MIDRDKVIKGLTVHLSNKVPPCDECPYANFEDMRRYNDQSSCSLSMAADALALLKEQKEPKQIVRKQCKKEYDDGSIDYFAEWYCPYCNLLILRGFDNPSIKFCYKCGKPILWEGR